MTNILKHISFGLIVVSFTLAACGGPAAPVNTPAPPPTQPAATAVPAAPTSEGGGASMSNPASDNCTKQGGDHLTIEKRGDGGEFGVCWFEDARQCEEWALLRGDCPVGGLKVTGYGPQGRYCAITGGQYTVTGGGMTNEQGTCAFKNDKQCDGADYFNGKCSP